MTLTATVTCQTKTSQKEWGVTETLHYTITLSNGLVVKRQSSEPKAAIGFHLELANEKGCRTTATKNIQTLRRQMGGLDGHVIVDLNTGEVTDCSQLPKPGTGRQAKKANGMTEAQQSKFERFCKAPARLEKRFLNGADYFLSCGDTVHLKFTAKRYQEAADYCRSLIGDTQTLAGLWNAGMRTGGDLESQIERAMKT